MTKREATQQAQREASAPYRTAASRTGEVTWGFSTPESGGFQRQNAIGTYRQAVAARREWITDRIAALIETE